MASVVVNGDTSGAVTLSAPAVAGTVTVTLPSTSGVMAVGGGTITTLTTTSDITVQGVTVGRGAGAVSTNTAVGSSALAANTTGSSNTAVGYQAIYYNTTGTSNVGVGYGVAGALGAGAGAINNITAIGYAALAKTTGDNNTAVGRLASYQNTSGTNNVSVGDSALFNNTTASYNTAVGYQAGYTNQTGTQNTFLGYGAGYTNNNNYNVFIGMEAGKVSTGTLNCFVGYNSGYNMTTGTKNTILGPYTGNQGVLDIRTASNYIVLSDGDGTPAAYRKTAGDWWFGVGGTGSDNQGVITLNGNAPAAGNGAYVNGLSNGTNAWLLGSYRALVSGTATWFTCANSGGGGVYLNGASATSWTAVSSDARQKKDFAPVEGLTAIMQVAPTKFRYEWETEADPIHMGFTAQNLLPIIPDMVVIKEELHEDGTPLMTVTPDYMIPVLVKAIQELKAEVDSLKAQINGASA